ACIAGCILLGWGRPQFGWGALLQLVIASVSAVLAEVVFKLCCKKSFETILKEFDYTSLVTGMLVGMNMYANSKWYVPLLASVFAVVVVKMLFGGTGKNIVNPAIAGRIFAFISFGAAFGGTMHFVNANGEAAKVLSPVTAGYIQGATPLQAMFGANAQGNTLTNLDLLLGTGVPGCIGEVCKIALIIGGIYLVVRGVLNFRWPLVYVATTGVVAVLINVIKGESFAQAISIFLPSILSGGLILGAIFMATDFVTTPNTKLGNYVYFVLLGVVTAVLRSAVKGEVVSFAILFMNLFVPLIDKYIVRKPFGYVKPQKAKKEAAK
ncbi:MAG: RnfABCDGE type electron transport complex subunit D, partial [Candidatus Fimimonas sp.]